MDWAFPPIVKSRREGQRDIVRNLSRRHQKAGSDLPSSPPSMLCIFIFEICCNTLHNELHAGNGHTVPQGLVTGGIRSGWDVCPPIRKTLQPLALKGCQAANQVYLVDDAFIVADILVADSLVIRTNQGTDGILIGLHDQIGGILMLSGAFCADHMVFLKGIRPLSGKDCMAIHGCQRIGNILLIPKPIPTVQGLAVNGISNDAVDIGALPNERTIITPSSSPGRDGW